jgi:dimethylhistidine N-methyltransferase
MARAKWSKLEDEPSEARSAIPHIGALSYRVESDEHEESSAFSAAEGDDAHMPGVINSIIGLHLVAEPPIVGAADPVIAANLSLAEISGELELPGIEAIALDPGILARVPTVDGVDEYADAVISEEFAAPFDAATDPAFRADVLAGLAARPRAIPARWFYDRRGSELFEAITQLPEYYLTRVERGILTQHASDIAGLSAPGCVVVEFGSGSSAKTPLLLSAVKPSAYVPIDISGDFLRESAAGLAQQFPDLPVYPLEGDFLKPLVLPAAIGTTPRLGFFPGSTIGNMSATAAIDLLRAMAGTLGDGGRLLIGIDRIKPAEVLVPGYDDARGVTAEFNLNLLHRINRELQADIPVGAFKHVAVWNDTEARIEMHLRAQRDVQFTVAGQPFAMARGETIHTENSHKYGPRDARLLLRAGGWTPVAEWTDPKGQFALILAEAWPIPAAP